MTFVRLLIAAFFAALLPTAAFADDAPCPPFEVTGSGPDLVLVPGLGSSPAVWDGVRESLARDYRLHFVHVAGFAGRAPEGDPDTLLARTRAEIIRHLDCRKVESAAFAGHSMGGFLGLTLAADHPDRINKVVVVDSLPFFPLIFDPAATTDAVRAQADGMRAQMAAQDDASFAAAQRMGARSLVQAPDHQAQIAAWSITSDRATFAGALHALMTTDLRPRLCEIQAPVTVIAAANPFAPRSRIEPLYTAAYAGLQQTQLDVIDDSFHFIMFDQPQVFEAALRAGLAG
ncbi:alpha/beta fold hydrolase [Erythrobacter dokdonensis]|uniref:Alpha/beta hydrolase fold protein n=1 Tax=Erythrobacter dokdonensis DSW-74 TaxID=1300349 RepID=A0A1A7BF08_9SPHN|nr:alpha/beta hydrolase [Erythrobacter dokdonensis]OBV11128.1 Alpha/beta hydrolase fold protein [Erythrobacter dokdonensis DSW-74]